MPFTGTCIYLPCRSNLIENMHRQYIRTGYIWEQYDDQQGSGKVSYIVCLMRVKSAWCRPDGLCHKITLMMGTGTRSELEMEVIKC